MYITLNTLFKCSSEYWTPSNIRNGRISTSCSAGSNNQALTFGESIIFQDNTFAGFTVTHAALTNVFSIKNITSNETSQSSLRHSSSSMVPTSTMSPIHITSMESSNSVVFSTSLSPKMLISTIMSSFPIPSVSTPSFIRVGHTTLIDTISSNTITASSISDATSTTLPDTTSSTTNEITIIEGDVIIEVSNIK